MSWSLARRLGHLMKHIDFSGECWIFTGELSQGYGKYSAGPAHRVAYELLVGPIPEGHDIDHLCRTPACVFPDHLEPVTPGENIRRRTAAKTHCKHGHEYTPENTYVQRRNGWAVRICRTCSVERSRAYKARKAAEVTA